MTTASAFRLSTYLTVALACGGLGYAEADLFPEVGFFATAVVAALAVIYRVETRVQLLSTRGANQLMTRVVLAGVLWATYRVVREVRTDEFREYGWPLFIVTLIAPVLMAAIAAKFLRREKHAGDYWYLHAAALGGVVLTAAMAERVASFVIMALYGVCAVWSLYLFHAARVGGVVPPIPGRHRGASPDELPSPVRGPLPVARTGLAGAVLIAAAAGAVAVPLYLLTPRSSFDKLDFAHQRVEIGYAADQMIDLHRTGELEANPDPAFEVVAEDEGGRPKEDLDPNQRWRGAVLTRYQNGTWNRSDYTELPMGEGRKPSTSGPWSPPDLGPGRYSLTFSIPAKLREYFLADPVVWADGQPSPVADLPVSGAPPRPWRPLGNGTIASIYRPTGRRTLRYVQYRSPLPDPDLGPGFQLHRPGSPSLVSNPVPRVKEYADRVLDRLVREGRLPPAAAARDAIHLRPAEQHHEEIARAFALYLVDRAGLAYTTDLPAVPKGTDPVEHFLYASRVGHCERFAAALALMLRSQGIPAVVVLGFKGCDHTGGGRYVIRQEYAHAWVEALIARPNPAGRAPNHHWLSLDPTPAAGVGRDGEGSDAAGGLLGWARASFNRYFLHYSEEDRERALRGAVEWLTDLRFDALVGVTLVTVVGVVLVRRRAVARRGAGHTAAAGWFDRLLVALARHGYVPQPGETAREFAAAVAAALRERPETRPLADVPVAWAAAYYHDRFGGRPIPADERAKLENDLDALRRALTDTHGATT